MSDQRTLDVYARKASDYSAMTDEYEAPQLAGFMADLPPGGHVLDIGCGPGKEAAAMARAGFKVTAVDAVPEMVELASAYPGVEARCETFDDLSGEDIYDGVWANFSLLHAPREDMPRHLAAIHRALKPGGRFHIAVKTGTESKRDRLDRLYTYFTGPELTGLLEFAGFTCTASEAGRSKGLDETYAGWIAISAHA
ncbi:class I SAM-dependent methyltransferase [Heliomarina baculiformis]|uniref:class I SAM-dependent methyltransferase n=1 Tax=Heliomarina baculiformis TaxID=2872036 RepID=UPI001EE21CF5|nr:class I SAM-dependent methyltransferase [Heliomarina baculiformis]